VDNIEFGIDTFGDLPRDDRGEIVSYAEAIRRVVAEGVLADEVGIDVIAVGEHHRPEFSISAPETVLAGIATQTERIHLASGVTVLSSDDPVRVFQRFATVDALSRGRAEVILGRGSFTESFPLFGYDLRDYEVLFDEKLDLFVKLLDEKPVTWEGTTRAALHDADVFPKTERGSLYIGAPETVARKMTRAIQTLGVGRFDLIYSSGGALSASARLRAVELYGTRVVPLVREMLAEQPVKEGSR